MANNTERARKPLGSEDYPLLWHTLTTEQVAEYLNVVPGEGLSETDALQRLERYGPNRICEEERESIGEVFLEEIREPMVLLLLLTGVLYAVWGEWIDAVTIFFVIVTLTAIEVLNEYRATTAIDALRKLSEPTAPLRRGGRTLQVPVETIVPGDLLLLQPGQHIPADARLVEAYGLSVDESALTGESVPVAKGPREVYPAEIPLAERDNLVFAGTTVTRGRGTALVVATGPASEIGRVADLAGQVTPPRTLLQKAMRELSGSLVWLALAFSVSVPLLGLWLTDQPLQDLLLIGLSLAFATIPEEMPIIITMVLALGGYRLSKQHAVVKALRAVETLGSVTVIATDKTGTLTENAMRVHTLYPPAQGDRLLKIGVLCSDASEDGGDPVGDPLEVALLRAAAEADLDIAALRCAAPLRDVFTFDNARRMMSVTYVQDGELQAAVKGAPEEVLRRCTHRWNGEVMLPLTGADRQAFLEKVAEMAAAGLRVIAGAERAHVDSHLVQDDVESDLTFIGLIGLADPPRPEIASAIQACRQAGIRPIMITGDHPATARAIACQVGMDGNGRIMTGSELDGLSNTELQALVAEVSLYARTTPEHKLRIVQALHALGERVAVTGDGINDAPALAAADIGVAMGETGTDVARAAGDLVLTDDNFATIVHAIREGRVVFANLKKGVRYYLACKVALISVTLLSTLLGIPVPFAPVQIILMELFMDLAAAATFVIEPGEGDLMRYPPRNPQARFMDREMILSIFVAAVGLFAAVAVAYLSTWYRGARLVEAQTLAFVTWLLGHVLLAWNLRSERQPLLQVGLFSNRLMVIWSVATVLFVLIVTSVPGVSTAFKTTSLDMRAWTLAVGAAGAGTLWMELLKWVRYRKNK